MTDCALAAPAPTSPPLLTTTPRARRTRRARPAGVPRWAWLFGVTFVPVASPGPDAGQAWVVSAGAGTTHAAVLFHDAPGEGNDAAPRGDRP
jgi:hypothetical protein